MKPILRKVDTGSHSFSIREDVLPFLYNHWHYHPELELTLIRKGHGMRLVGDSVEQFGDGDLILLGSNLPHVWRSDAEYFKGDERKHVEAIAIHFREDFWGATFLDLPELKPVRELLEKARRGIKITGETKQLLSARMESITGAGEGQRIASLLNMLDILANSREFVFLSSVGFSNAYDVVNTEKINVIYDYTFTHFQRRITIDEVAAAANISPHSFCRYFKSRTLKTYGRFIQEVRIGYARKLLIEDKMGVSQIAYSCGFNNLSNFNRQFKALTGKTPLRYTKEYVTAQLL